MTNDNCCNFKVLELNKIQIITTMFAEYKVTELFYMADDFYKFFLYHDGKNMFRYNNAQPWFVKKDIPAQPE